MIQKIRNVYIVVEGSSEKAFFTRLNSYCSQMDIPINFKIENAESHQLTKVLAAVKRAGKKIKKDKGGVLTTEVIVFLDYDVFKRDEDIKPYLNKFHQRLFFFEYNFEDFLVSLLPIEQRKIWEKICKENNHYTTPMKSSEVEHFIKKIFPDYKKGFCPLTEITQDHIANMEIAKYRENIPHATDFLLNYISPN